MARLPGPGVWRETQKGRHIGPESHLPPERSGGDVGDESHAQTQRRKGEGGWGRIIKGEKSNEEKGTGGRSQVEMVKADA